MKSSLKLENGKWIYRHEHEVDLKQEIAQFEDLMESELAVSEEEFAKELCDAYDYNIDSESYDWREEMWNNGMLDELF